MPEITGVFRLDGKLHEVSVRFCSNIARQMMGEIFSPLNVHATQVFYSAHQPDPKQLLDNYIGSGGMGRFLRIMRDVALVSIRKL